MSYAARAGEVTVLQIEDASTPGTYGDVGYVVSVDPPEMSAETVDRFVLGAGAKTFRSSKKYDPGELGFTLKYDPSDTVHARIRTLLTTGASTHFRILYDSDTATHPTDTFLGFVTKFKPGGMEEDSDVNAEVTVKVSGAITTATVTLS